MWCIPPAASAAFVAAMEDVLAVYHRPYDPDYPQVNLDETNKQLVGEVRDPLPVARGAVARYDNEYERKGTANLFMAFEPLAGWREVTVTDTRTRADWARVARALVDGRYKGAKKVVLVMDNLNTHSVASLYAAFPPEEARRVAERLEIHYTPKHGSWLNMAEVELSALARQCLDRRIEDKQTLQREAAAWQQARNDAGVKASWRFTTADARTKLRKLYPTIDG